MVITIIVSTIHNADNLSIEENGTAASSLFQFDTGIGSEVIAADNFSDCSSAFYLIIALAAHSVGDAANPGSATRKLGHQFQVAADLGYPIDGKVIAVFIFIVAK